MSNHDRLLYWVQMGTGNRLVQLVDKIMEATDTPPEEREKLEQLLERSPSDFTDEYREYLSTEDAAWLRGAP